MLTTTFKNYSPTITPSGVQAPQERPERLIRLYNEILAGEHLRWTSHLHFLKRLGAGGQGTVRVSLEDRSRSLDESRAVTHTRPFHRGESLRPDSHRRSGSRHQRGVVRKFFQCVIQSIRVFRRETGIEEVGDDFGHDAVSVQQPFEAIAERRLFASALANQNRIQVVALYRRLAAAFRSKNATPPVRSSCCVSP